MGRNDAVGRCEQWIILGNGLAADHIDSSTPNFASDLVAAGRLYSDYTESTRKESGEYLVPLQEGLIGEDHIRGSLGELLLGKAEGRVNDTDITIFDALGLAVEDVASAKMVYLEATK